ncbi:LytTR family DNA-binding domain-containing protein [Thalassorhabdus alkalitolerans]|uniref:LytTR family DNA-binding domain-containing protein n=1 Tax=Thalassorhabdus alkalitolerans TaxID=2282697 RepID=A0ABW0YL55_9BACI|nr:LytTR family DNA-binding domain-containing protein [Thalassobacillus sp. C254]
MIKVNIDIDNNHNEMHVTIHAKEWSPDIEELIKKINHQTPKRIVGTEEDKSILLEPGEIDFIYAEKRKVFASINNHTIELNMKLYEAEEMLLPYDFTRFSKSVIGNVNNIKRFEVAFNGNLCVFFKSGSKEYVSRKYVLNLKNKLIMGMRERK